MSRARRLLTRIIFALGVATFCYLLWTFQPARVWARLAGFGWAFTLVLPFQIVDHLCNALGWRLAFAPSDARLVPFWELLRVRVAGDSLNYLTPSANLAGELVRPGMLGGAASPHAKIASVVVAKAAQAAAQSIFILLGMAYLLAGRSSVLGEGRAAWSALAVAIILLVVAGSVAAFAAEPPAWLVRRAPRFVARSVPVRLLLRGYLKRHPFRLCGSAALFMLGYVWGAAEIWLIARLLGAQLGAHDVFAIEVLSNLVDLLAFMVPAKIGTQEGGKAFIFKGLGLSSELGFSVGLIRHIRELCWAALGLALYAAQRRVGRTGAITSGGRASEERADASRVA